MLHQRARGRERETSARADSHQAIVRFNDVAIAGKNERALGVGNDQQGFQMAQRAVLAPFLGQLDRRLLEIAGKLLQLAFKALKKRNRVGRGACETGNDLVVVEAARLARRVLHHVIAHGHLAIGDEHHLVVLAHAQNRGAVHRRASRTISHSTIIAPVDPSATKAVQGGRSILKRPAAPYPKGSEGRMISGPRSAVSFRRSKPRGLPRATDGDQYLLQVNELSVGDPTVYNFFFNLKS